MNTSIRPGKPWYDTNGNRIQAHAGAIHFEHDTFYWYGENKEHTDGKSKIWTSGIRCYSSQDLYNWQDLGLIIQPNTTDKKDPLHEYRRIDRPHILYNDATGKYVCWLKMNGRNSCFHILTADRFLGPYTMAKAYYQPYGLVAGDFDLVKDSETQKAYLYFCSEWKGVFACEVSDDYLGVTERHTKLYEGLIPPFCREGIAIMERDGLRYLFSSGMTGYIPNPSEVASFSSWLGSITIQGNPHVNDDSFASFNSQISTIFKHPYKKDLYITLADRWVPNYIVTRERYEQLSRIIASNYDRKNYKATLREKLDLMKTPMMASANTSIAEYVWLPLRFDGEKAVIDWLDEWRLEDFEQGIT